LIDGELRGLDEEIVLEKQVKHEIAVVVDRLVMRPDVRKRLVDSIETAPALADGIVSVTLAPREGQSAGGAAALPGEVPLPEVRNVDARARAADLLLQRATGGLPALHGPRVTARDRPGACRARSAALDLAGRARPVGREQLGLLRPDDRRTRGALRDRRRGAVAHPQRGPARGL